VSLFGFKFDFWFLVPVIQCEKFNLFSHSLAVSKLGVIERLALLMATWNTNNFAIIELENLDSLERIPLVDVMNYLLIYWQLKLSCLSFCSCFFVINKSGDNFRPEKISINLWLRGSRRRSSSSLLFPIYYRIFIIGTTLLQLEASLENILSIQS
jgi:hypothetical protein